VDPWAQQPYPALPPVQPQPQPQPQPPITQEPKGPAVGLAAKWKGFVAKYGRMLWWAHSVYALALGISVVLFASKGFAHARWLSISLGVVWIVVIVFFRLFGDGKNQSVDPKAKMRFYVMTYVLKNLYQGMLFFLLPFYWRSAVWDAPTMWYVVVLAACALLSTLDVVFDQLLMKWKIAASLFYFLTLFCCLNLVIPALFPNTRSLVTLVLAGGIASLSFWTMHIPFRYLGRPGIVALLVGWTLAALAGSYFGRRLVPPVAMHVEKGAIGPRMLEDGRLAIEATSLHTSLINEYLWAVTDVYIPGGKGDRLVHVWRLDGEVVQRTEGLDVSPAGTTGFVRLTSLLLPENCPDDRAGHWLVDVETQDGQLVGRVEFDVID
jgi:hypothetical protein